MLYFIRSINDYTIIAMNKLKELLKRLEKLNERLKQLNKDKRANN